MKILIVYGSTEGQTKKIAERAADCIAKWSHKVDLIDSEDAKAQPDWQSYDGLIIAGSVHQERHQDSLINFVIAHLKQLRELPSALISVSLSAATDDGLPAAAEYVERFSTVTKYTPDRTHLAAGALRYSKYDYFKIEIVKHVVSKTAGSFEPTGDHEFTDWDALFQFLGEFLSEINGKGTGVVKSL